MINWDEPIEVLSNSFWYTAKLDYLGKRVAVISYENEELIYNRDTAAPWVRNKQKEPEEQWRPFQTDELDSLFLQIIRAKDSDDKCVITRICGVAIQFGARWYSSNELFGLCELKQDGLWGPCGVKEL